MKITRNDIMGGTLLSCAVRYALGRSSYMPSLVIDEITKMLSDMPIKTLRNIEQDLWRYKCNEAEFDDEYIRNAWEKFRSDVCNEIDRRTEVGEDD